MTRRQRSWTTKEVARVKQLRQAGLMIVEVARIVGRTVGSVRHALKANGLVKKVPPFDREKMLALHRQGLPSAEIIRRMKAGRDRVYRALRRLGLKSNGHNRQSRRLVGRRIKEAIAGDNWMVRVHRERAARMGWPETYGAGFARVLQGLLEFGPVTIAELHKRLGIHSQNTRNYVRRLVALGQVVVVGEKRVRHRKFDLAEWLRRKKEEERNGC